MAPLNRSSAAPYVVHAVHNRTVFVVAIHHHHVVYISLSQDYLFIYLLDLTIQHVLHRSLFISLVSCSSLYRLLRFTNCPTYITSLAFV